MHLRHGRQLADMGDLIGAACAYAIILGMLATALAPLFVPLFQK
ncbi:MAG TPA: hypothetical protein VLX44_21490 [Xanthobacteraceae bacterium]|nr:hypothetical protein [Xanthobacteraceae bacterium]